MNTQNSSSWTQPSGFNPTGGCAKCQGVLQHQSWCDSLNPRVRYAHEVVVDASLLSQPDRLYLHALGVLWGQDMPSA